MGESHDSHPSDKELKAFLSGRLRDSRSSAVEHHVCDCEKCCQAPDDLSNEEEPFLAPLRHSSLDFGQSVFEKVGQSSVDNRLPEETENWFGPYKLLSVLGEGGMGRVYRAQHQRLNRLVALKMVKADCLNDPEHIVRFSLEAESVARLQHPNIVQIYDVGYHHKRPYFALELVDGRSLDELSAESPVAHRDGQVHPG